MLYLLGNNKDMQNTKIQTSTIFSKKFNQNIEVFKITEERKDFMDIVKYVVKRPDCKIKPIDIDDYVTVCKLKLFL